MPVRQPQPARNKTDTLIGIDESDLWSMADALRGSMDAAEYKHVVLGLIFLKYISGAFEERHAAVLAEWGSEAAEDPDEYTAESIFWVPPEARWAHLKAQARQSTIGQLVDDAMAGVERDNPVLRNVLPKDYARPAMDKQRLGQLIDMIGNRWRAADGDYKDAPGFCLGVPLDELRRHDHVPTPGRYVGTPPATDDEPFAEKMQRLVVELHDQQADGACLDAAISKNLAALGFASPSASKL